MADDLIPRPPGNVEPAQRPRPAPGTRSATEIRNDIVREREELGKSVEALRGRVGELTDWRRQVREHRRELIIGAGPSGLRTAPVARLADALRPETHVYGLGSDVVFDCALEAGSASRSTWPIVAWDQPRAASRA